MAAPQSPTRPYPFSERARRTTDSPITWLMRKAIENPAILSLAAGFVDKTTLPDDLLRDAMEKVFASEDPKGALQYGTTVGLQKLRAIHAERLRQQGLETIDPDRLLISNGGQQSLYCMMEVLIDPGDVVLVEDPTYFVFMDVLKSAGARVLGVSTDEEGMIPSALVDRLQQVREMGLRERLKALYVMSYYSNPKGSNMSAKRREELYEVFRRECEAGEPFLLVEDASYRDLCLEGKDEPFIKELDPENEWVLLQGTFSKALCPGLRLGWSYMPEEVHTAVCRQKSNQDFGSSNLNQNVLAEMLEAGSYDVAAARFRDRYRAKRDALLAAMREFWPADSDILEPFGGLYVWVRLPGVNTDPGSPFFEDVLGEDVLYVPGHYCYCEETQEERPNDAMRICYGVVEIEPMREAVRRMGLVAERHRPG